MRAPVAPKGWPSATLPPLGFMRSRGNFPSGAVTPRPFREPCVVFERGEMAQHLRRKGLVDLPQRDVGVDELVTREQARYGERRRHQQSIAQDVYRSDLPIDQPHARQV